MATNVAQANHSVIAINTERFGQLKWPSENIIEMQHPIIGFEDETAFILVPHAENSPFTWLQSVKTPSLAFILTHPIHFGQDYQPVIPKWIREQLSAKPTTTQEQSIDIYTIVTIPDANPELMTANCLAPIAINTETGLGAQIVLDSHHHTTRTRLIPQADAQDE